MHLSWLDWLAIVAYFAGNIAIGLYYRSRRPDRPRSSSSAAAT